LSDNDKISHKRRRVTLRRCSLPLILAVLNHLFADGNKRIAAVAMLLFLEQNGVDLHFTQKEFADFFSLAAGDISRYEFDSGEAKEYRDFLYEDADLTVDADIEYNPRTTEFYEKNGFVVNSSKKRRASDKTVSMRRDIF